MGSPATAVCGTWRRGTMAALMPITASHEKVAVSDSNAPWRTLRHCSHYRAAICANQYPISTYSHFTLTFYLQFHVSARPHIPLADPI